ncbi:hypothetical protein GCM10023189_17250 [Nibrella saemangeumensis]|uniref:Uncharacterized protein n=1 Tax=Nibrella saemangeumensis TaxID=1084526 RepID=A0ABP8MQU8_9BACT
MTDAVFIYPYNREAATELERGAKNLSGITHYMSNTGHSTPNRMKVLNTCLPDNGICVNG